MGRDKNMTTRDGILTWLFPPAAFSLGGIMAALTANLGGGARVAFFVFFGLAIVLASLEIAGAWGPDRRTCTDGHKDVALPAPAARVFCHGDCGPDPKRALRDRIAACRHSEAGCIELCGADPDSPDDGRPVPHIDYGCRLRPLGEAGLLSVCRLFTGDGCGEYEAYSGRQRSQT